MNNIKAYLYLVFLFILAGCATQQKSESPEGALREQLVAVSHKFELAKKENLNLKRQLLLYKKSQNVDTQKFVKAQEVFEKELSKETRAGDLGIRMTDRGMIIIIKSEKLFVSASDVLDDPGKAFLDKIVDLIESQFGKNYIYIEGHTDNQSLAVFEWKSDWEFSFARALSVLKYFSDKKGMDPLLLSASGFGQYRPLASNETKEGRALNRRIEIIISSQELKHPIQKK